MKFDCKLVIETILALSVNVVFSWFTTCWVIKLITLCFGLQFSWRIATGIWLIICLIRNIFENTEKKE